jgi:hypothetical protein
MACLQCFCWCDDYAFCSIVQDGVFCGVCPIAGEIESTIAISANTFYVFRMEPVSVGTYVDVTFTPQDANGQGMDVDEAGLSVICTIEDGSAHRSYVRSKDSSLSVASVQDVVAPAPPDTETCVNTQAARPWLPAVNYFDRANMTISYAANSTVTVRFYLEDIHGEPVPYLTTTNFTVFHGVNCRALYESTESLQRQEGSIAIASGGGQSSTVTKFMSLLIDSSNTVKPDAMKIILLTFIDALKSEQGDIYVKLICFSGGRQLLTLTTDCPEEFCSVHNQTEWDLLNGIVQTYESELEEWDAWDSHSTSFYQSVYKAAQEFKLASRARAHLLLSNPDHAPASTTTEHLIIFSDVDETSYPVAVPDRDPNDNSMRSKMFQALRQGDRSSTVSLIYLDQQGDSYETVTSDITELDAVLKHVYEATQVADLAGVFLDMAVRIDREANAWYELILCPPERGGENIYLQVQTPEYDGSLEVYFDAKGFTNSCPESQSSVSQAESSSLCDQRSCGFEVRH